MEEVKDDKMFKSSVFMKTRDASTRFGTLWNGEEEEEHVVETVVDTEPQISTAEKMVNFLNATRTNPCIIVGPTGSGKTTQVGKWADESFGVDNVYTYRGHSTTDKSDMVGLYIRRKNDMVYSAGPITKAFLKAREGETVCIIVDEIGRIPDAEKDFLVGLLTPNHKDEYCLDTNKAVEGTDGFWFTETICVPKERIMFIGMTNIGSGYNTELGDNAFVERFKFHIQPNVINVNSSVPLVASFIDAYGDLFSMSSEGLMPLNWRHITELEKAIERGQDGKEFINTLAYNLIEREFDGTYPTDQLKTYRGMVATI
jgi:hypothetical protein